MTELPSLPGRLKGLSSFRRSGIAVLGLALVAAQAAPAHATIDNTANAEGTYGSNPVTTTTPGTANVPVVPAAPALTVTKSAAAPVDVDPPGPAGPDGVIKGGDTITYTFTVTNSGNVTINGVVPVDQGVTFNNVAGTGTLGPFSPASATLAPGASQAFTAVYTLSDADAFRAAGITVAGGDAVENSAIATGTPVAGTLGTVTPATAEVAIPANPKLTIAKSWAFKTPGGDANGNGFADLNDDIIYTYTVINAGNVTIDDVTIDDIHEGAPVPTGSGVGTITKETLVSDGPVGTSTDASQAPGPFNGSWDVMRAGATITFEYEHNVTQAEVDGG